MTLSQDLRSLNEAVLALDGRLERVDNGRLVNQQTVKTIQLAVDGINEQLSQLANANNALLGLEVLSEQVDRLTQQANQQQEIIDAVDASRKQLTQRIIDLNERINSAPTPGEQ
jgi:chromosome segregation ATPase